MKTESRRLFLIVMIGALAICATYAAYHPGVPTSQPVTQWSYDGREYIIDRSGRRTTDSCAYENRDEEASTGLVSTGSNYGTGYRGKARNQVTPRMFTWSGGFKDGLAVVRMSSGCGVIDTSGKFVIEPFFDAIASFDEGIAAASVDGKVGLIDKKGKWLVKPQFRAIRGFSDGLALVETMDGKSAFIKRDGKIALSLTRKLSERTGFEFEIESDDFELDAKNTWFTDPIFGKARSIYTFREGLCPMDANGKMGFIDKTGRFVIPAKFDMTFPFHEGLAPVAIGVKRGFIDKKGNIVIKPQFKQVANFSDGMAAVENDEFRWGFIDKSGKLVIDYKFRNVWPFKNGRAKVSE